MSRLLALILAVLGTSFGIYYLFISILIGRTPSLSEFHSPTTNHSLNASIAHWKHHQSSNIIIGSSVALRNLSAKTLSTKEKKWTVIGGFGLHPIKTLQLVTYLDLKNAEVIIPISSFELNKMAETMTQRLSYKSINITTTKDFIAIEKMKRKGPNDIGHLNLDTFGNALFADRDITSIPQGRIGATFKIDTTSFSAFCALCQIQGRDNNIKFRVITTPFNNRFGTIQNNGDSLLLKFKFQSSHCALEHHFFDVLPDSMFIDSHHLNKEGADLLTKRVQSYQ